MTRIVFIALAVLVFSSCAKVMPYPFYDDWVSVDRVYSTGGDLGKMRTELVGFLGRAESNVAEAKKDSRLNYTFILGENWLRLAVICDRMGDRAIFEEAIAHAVDHFDMMPDFAADPGYQTSKKEMLVAFLARVEKERPPAWRAALENKEPNQASEPTAPSDRGSP